MVIMLRDGSTVQDPRLDRIPAPNPAALAAYPIRGLLGAGQQTVIGRTWQIPAPLDQGQEGACVAFGWTHDLLAKPYIVHGAGQDTAVPLYWRIQQADPWPGGSYPGAQPRYEGTSVEAGAKVLTEAGHYREYRWAEQEQDVALAIGYHGPVVLGINWYEGMFHPGDDGFIRPTGQLAGGHCILAYAVSTRNSGYYRLLNSWGPDWGQAGTCKISRADLTTLLTQDGEACLPVRRRRTQYALAG